MENSKYSSEKRTNIHEICFGLNRETDEQSLIAFLKRFTNDALIDTLIPRLESQEINDLVDFLTGLMHAHITKEEYHRLFLK